MDQRANERKISSEGETCPAQDPAAPSGQAALVCAALGGLGWLALVPFLDRCEQGEQLARYFAALFNLIVISVGGGIATLLTLAGFFLARRTKARGNPEGARLGTRLAGISLGIGLVVIVTHLPTILRIMH